MATVTNAEVSVTLPCPSLHVKTPRPILLGQSKVDDVDLVGLLSQSNQKIIRLDVPVDEILGVHVLDPGMFKTLKTF